MTNDFEKLENLIVGCKKCARLVSFREKIAKEKRKQFINEKYWGKPITGFGDPKARILFVGLAPAAHGAIELEEFLQEIDLLIFYINVYTRQIYLTNQIQTTEMMDLN